MSSISSLQAVWKRDSNELTLHWWELFDFLLLAPECWIQGNRKTSVTLSRSFILFLLSHLVYFVSLLKWTQFSLPFIMLKVSHALDHFCHHSLTQHRLAHPLNLYCGLFSTELQNKSLLIPFLAHTQSCLLCSLPAEHPNPSLVACPVFSPTCSSSCRCSAFSHFHLYQNSLWSHPRGSGPCHHLSWASWPGLAPICLLPHPPSELRDCPQYSHLHLGVQRTANKPLLVMKALSLVLFIACLGAFSLLSKQVLIANPIFAQKKMPIIWQGGAEFQFQLLLPLAVTAYVNAIMCLWAGLSPRCTVPLSCLEWLNVLLHIIISQDLFFYFLFR